MRIVQVCASLNNFRGGAEQFCFTLLTSLAKTGHDVTLVTGDRETSNLSHFPFRMIVIPEAQYRVARKLLFDYFNPYAVSAFKTIIADIKPDLVHFHSFYGLSSALARVANAYCPVIVTLHDSWAAFYDSSIISLDRNFANTLWKTPLGYLHRKVNLFFLQDTSLVSPSIWMKEYFEQLHFGSPTHIPNGITDSDFTTSYQGLLLWVGHLTKFKGLPSVIDTLASRASHMGWRLVVVGDGPYKQELQTKYRTVEFVGYCNPEVYYRQASILIISSLGYENLPTVILEAMRHGICVVGHGIGGIAELIQHKETGVLYNSTASLDKSLATLMNTPSVIHQLGDAAQETFYKRYRWDQCYNKYLDLYRSLVDDT